MDKGGWLKKLYFHQLKGCLANIHICYYQVSKHGKGDVYESIVVQSIYKVSIIAISNNNE